MLQIEKFTGRNISDLEKIDVYGPRGGRWTELRTVDGRFIGIIGPDVHGRLPKWVKNAYGNLTRAGGTTYEWSGWIKENVCLRKA